MQFAFESRSPVENELVPPQIVDPGADDVAGARKPRGAELRVTWFDGKAILTVALAGDWKAPEPIVRARLLQGAPYPLPLP